MFRERALAHQADPDRLDLLAQIAPRSQWLVAIVVALSILSTLAWAAFGRLERRVAGNGVFTSANGQFEAVALGSGPISEIYVLEGDWVDEGALIASQRHGELIADIDVAKKRIDQLVQSYNDLMDKKPMQVNDQVNTMMDSWRLLQTQAAQDLRTAKARLEVLETTRKRTSGIRAPVAGRVIKLLRVQGEQVETSEVVAVIEPKGPKQVTAFVTHGAQYIEPEMEVRVLPSTIRVDEAGFARGRVRRISKYPQSREAVMKVVQDTDRVSALLASGQPFLVEVVLDEHPDAAGQIQWSIGDGPGVDIPSGTPASIQVVVGGEAPINVLIPGLSRL